MNRLQYEKSPYLRMHADNPIDWYPWGPEAFEKAKRENKPLFLSVGYSSCHWCHVIAAESFSDPGVAGLLNSRFVPVKVDKEERPDVDAVYMQALQALEGSGGWPMTIIATPEGHPFYAATYLPKSEMIRVLNLAWEQWQKDTLAITAAAERFTRTLRDLSYTFAPASADLSLLKGAFHAFSEAYDSQYGGFGDAPKFPSGQNILFLLAYYGLTGQADALEMALSTLDHMYRGGIFDHVGGGICRYATDRRWLIPHFEKTLYDNAVTAAAFAEAYRMTGRGHYRAAAEGIAAYIRREMTGPEGELYAAQDADANGREGAYYLFTQQELCGLLGQADGELFCRSFGIAADGGLPNLLGKDLRLHAKGALDRLRETVYRYRVGRMPLLRDEKVITGWNGMMIAAFVRLSRILEEPEWLTAAVDAFAFLRKNLCQSFPLPRRRWIDGEARYAPMLEDLAYYALAACALFDATEQADYLEAAIAAADAIVSDYAAPEGGCYLYGKSAEQLILRPREPFDNAYPGGNSVFCLVLLLLHRHTKEDRWRDLYEKQMQWLAGAAARYPMACAGTLYTAALALAEQARISP
jgi:uncharacterized protein YyaL (SSP411 family)